MTAAVPGARGIKADCITDGACTESSAYFQKSSNAATGSPYMFTIDMQKEAVISEINLRQDWLTVPRLPTNIPLKEAGMEKVIKCS